MMGFKLGDKMDLPNGDRSSLSQVKHSRQDRADLQYLGGNCHLACPKTRSNKNVWKRDSSAERHLGMCPQSGECYMWIATIGLSSQG